MLISHTNVKWTDLSRKAVKLKGPCEAIRAPPNSQVRDSLQASIVFSLTILNFISQHLNGLKSCYPFE